MDHQLQQLTCFGLKLECFDFGIHEVPFQVGRSSEFGQSARPADVLGTGELSPET
jgi:hypothetical protein